MGHLNELLGQRYDDDKSSCTRDVSGYIRKILHKMASLNERKQLSATIPVTVLLYIL